MFIYIYVYIYIYIEREREREPGKPRDALSAWATWGIVAADRTAWGIDSSLLVGLVSSEVVNG